MSIKSSYLSARLPCSCWLFDDLSLVVFFLLLILLVYEVKDIGERRAISNKLQLDEDESSKDEDWEQHHSCCQPGRHSLRTVRGRGSVTQYRLVEPDCLSLTMRLGSNVVHQYDNISTPKGPYGIP